MKNPLSQLVCLSVLSALVLAMISSSSRAAGASGENYSEAIHKTQAELKNPNARKGLIQGGEAAKTADQVKSLAGTELNEQQLYEIAAQVLGEVQGGSPEALSEAIAQAQKDPKAFLQKLSPEVQKKIRDLAGKIEKKSTTKP